jgi:hypothetical protein
MRYLVGLALALVIAGVGLGSSVDTAAADYPAAGSDHFCSDAVVDLWVDLDGDGLPDTYVPDVPLSDPTTVLRGDPGDADHDGLADIQTEIVSMELKGKLFGLPITIKAGSDFALRPSIGAVEQQAPGVDFPADSFFDVYIELDGTPYGPLRNYPPNAPSLDPIHMSATIHGLPPYGDTYRSSGADVRLWDSSHQVRVILTASTEEHTPRPCGQGGIVELQVGGGADSPTRPADGSASSAPYAALAGGAAAAALALMAGGWYARKRLLR